MTEEEFHSDNSHFEINHGEAILPWMSRVICAIVAVLFSNVALAWNVQQSEDEMTGDVSVYVSSDKVKATKTLSFPYRNLKSWLGFGCDKDSEWAYIGFSSAPNLINNDVRSGYSIINTRVKWDDSVNKEPFSQTWGDEFLHFSSYGKAIQNYMNKSAMLLEIKWYGLGNIYFNYSLIGSSKAIKKARQICKTS